MALCFLSKGPLQFISSKHIQKKRNEEEGAGKTESEVFVTIVLLVRNKSFGKSHSRQKGRGLHRVWTRSEGPGVRDQESGTKSQGPGVRDQESAAAHTNSLLSWMALLLNMANPEADCLGVLSLALAPERAPWKPPGPLVPTPICLAVEMSELSSIQLPRDPGPLNSTNLNSIKLMGLGFSAPLEVFQINNHMSPFLDPSLTEAKGGLLPGFPSAMLHTPKGLAERQSFKKGRVCGVHLPPPTSSP